MPMPQSAVGACGLRVLARNTDSTGAYTSLCGLCTYS